MSPSENGGDLHIHTTQSDGRSTVGERVKQASERSLQTIAITDHDSIPTELTSRAETRSGVELVTGVEIRADVDGSKVEILGYFVDPSNETLLTMLDRVRRYRERRNRQIIATVNEETPLDLSYDELRDKANGMVSRPHIADALVESGLVSSIGAAFDEYLGADGVAFVPMNRLDNAIVIDAIHEAGGVASLAHPGRIRTDSVPEVVELLCRNDLDGIEVWYPYDSDRSDRYADIDVGDAHELADTYNLLKTGGSDCHGPGSGKFRIGNVTAPIEAVYRLRERANDHRPL